MKKRKFKLIPESSQWKKWNLPSKTSYIGFTTALISLTLSIVVFITDTDLTRRSYESFIELLQVEVLCTVQNMGKANFSILISAVLIPTFISVSLYLLSNKNAQKRSRNNIDRILTDAYLDTIDKSTINPSNG